MNQAILNKLYSVQEYEKLISKIIAHMRSTGEWGMFFDPKLSPFGYNETVAQEYFPKTRKEILGNIGVFRNKHYREGIRFHWSDYVAGHTIPTSYISSHTLPDTIAEVSDEILNHAILCETSQQFYKITPEELGWHRLHNVPLSKNHPHQRYIQHIRKNISSSEFSPAQ